MKRICGPLLGLAAVVGAVPALADTADVPAADRSVGSMLTNTGDAPVSASLTAPAAAIRDSAPAPYCDLSAQDTCRVGGLDQGEGAVPGLAEGVPGWDLARLAAAGPSPDGNPAALALEPDLGADGTARYRLADQGCGLACYPPGSGIPDDWADHVPADQSRTRGFWKQAGAVKTESLLFLGYFSSMTVIKLTKDTKAFHFKDEGWFGKDTDNIGIDKLTHAFNTYLLAEFLHDRIHRRTEASAGDALTAGLIASGLMLYNEFSDGIEVDSGWSIQDVAMNFAGAGFSVLRNTVPGLKEKLAFKIEVIPNGQIYSHTGKKHYEQQRFMLSLRGAGFHQLDNSPLRYLDLQVGYYASDFTNQDREAGIEPKRHLFVGVGLNLGELLFGKSTSKLGRAAYSVLDYFQVPYTSLRYDTTGRFGN
ncbi:DUF2279 domain-containing protein [Novosphingobium soli]|uniref:DUF2279 domain-containing protein n=1 Tax=Novosphingobium soli TaxID=574956 RepID=A0ABV6CXQ4_9SPHN